MYKINGSELEDFLIKKENNQSIIYETNQANIVSNQFESNGELILQSNQYKIKESLDIFGKGENHLLELQFNLSQFPISFKDKNKKGFLTPAMSGNLSFLNQDENQANIYFEENKVYQTFDIHIPLESLAKYHGYSHTMDNFLKNIDQQISSYLLSNPLSINANVLGIIKEIKNCSFEGLSRRIFFEAKTFELLSTLVDFGDHINKNKTLSSSEIDKIKYAAFLIKNNVDNPLTIPEISRIIGINQTKLKIQFKQVFEMTIFDFLQKIRMTEAKNYLSDTNLSIQEIGNLVGYKSSSNFSSAFKNVYGLSPIIYRNQLIEK